MPTSTPAKTTVTLAAFVALAGLATQVPSPWWEGPLLSVEVQRPAESASGGDERTATTGVVALPALDDEPGTSAASPTPTPTDGSADHAPGDGSGTPLPADPRRAQLAEGLGAVLAPLGPPVAPIERPCIATAPNGTCARRALDRYLEQLVLNALGTAERPARYTQFGDSLVMGDGFMGELRRLMRPQFGDGGQGFVYVANPERPFGIEGLVVDLSDAWDVRSVVHAGTRDPWFGLAGASFEPAGAPTFGARLPEPDPADTHARTVVADRVGVLLLPRSAHVSIEARADGEPFALSAAVEPGRSALVQADVPGRPRRLRLSGFPDRALIYGVILENRRGVVFDNAGLVSSRMEKLARIDREHWQQQVRLRDPDVVSFFFGANEAREGDFADGGAETRAEYAAVLERVRTDLPERDCMVLSILTRADWVDGAIVTRPSVATISGAQHEAAVAAGCAWFDTYATIGGLDGAATWYRARPQLLGSDLSHPTREGYRELARRFHHALLWELAEYLSENP